MTKWGIIILAAGKGTRMMSSTPKVLQKLCGKEMLNLVLSNVRSVIDGEYIVVVPSEYELIKKAVNQKKLLKICKSINNKKLPSSNSAKMHEGIKNIFMWPRLKKIKKTQVKNIWLLIDLGIFFHGIKINMKLGM